MTTEDQVLTDPGKTPPDPVALQTPPIPPKPEGGTQQQPPAKANDGASREPKRVRLHDDDDKIPEDADLLELSRTGLKSRLQRHTAKELRDRFGTNDFDDIKKKLDRGAELEAAEEKRKRDSMTETEKLQADLETANRLKDDAERRYRLSVEDRVVDAQEQRITALAKEYVDPEYIDVLLPKLARHLKRNYSDSELKKLKDEKIGEWFKTQVEKKPKLGKDFGVAPSEPEKRKVPHSNGARQEKKPDPKPSGSGGKARSFAPSAENAMTSQEAKAEARKNGYTW